jgi:hypothetical protein
MARDLEKFAHFVQTAKDIEKDNKELNDWVEEEIDKEHKKMRRFSYSCSIFR